MRRQYSKNTNNHSKDKRVDNSRYSYLKTHHDTYRKSTERYRELRKHSNHSYKNLNDLQYESKPPKALFSNEEWNETELLQKKIDKLIHRINKKIGIKFITPDLLKDDKRPNRAIIN